MHTKHICKCSAFHICWFIAVCLPQDQPRSRRVFIELAAIGKHLEDCRVCFGSLEKRAAEERFVVFFFFHHRDQSNQIIQITICFFPNAPQNENMKWTITLSKSHLMTLTLVCVLLLLFLFWICIYPNFILVVLEDREYFTLQSL